jgi:transposase-like protein
MCAPTFPIADLLDEDLCYLWLMRARWPGAKPVRPKCGEVKGVYHHSVEPNGPVEDFRCKKCGGVFYINMGTIVSRTKRPCCEVILILRSFAQGFTTNRLSKGLETDYDMLLELRHRYQAGCIEGCFGKPGFGAQDSVEHDKMYQNVRETR